VTEKNSAKFEMQARQYEFPYHYIPHFSAPGVPSMIRKLTWGLEYLCYQEHLKQRVARMAPRSVLEVGCGDGFFIGSLPADIPVRIGVDLAEQAIAFAKAFHPDCQFYAQDACEIDGVFELVAAVEVIEHIPDDELAGFFEGLYRKLEANGRVLISVPTTVVPLNRKHYRHYTSELLEQQLIQSRVPLRMAEVEYVFRTPWWNGTLRRILSNRFFTMEVNALMRIAWRLIWHHYRIADRHTGRHMVAVLERT
jgi:SAM-dependent methyltransferase